MKSRSKTSKVCWFNFLEPLSARRQGWFPPILGHDTSLFGKFTKANSMELI